MDLRAHAQDLEHKHLLGRLKNGSYAHAQLKRNAKQTDGSMSLGPCEIFMLVAQLLTGNRNMDAQRQAYVGHV